MDVQRYWKQVTLENTSLYSYQSSNLSVSMYVCTYKRAVNIINSILEITSQSQSESELHYNWQSVSQ
jgi:hypothetical protein